MEAGIPIFVVIVSELFITLLVGLVVAYMVLARHRTVTTGREQAIFETLSLANRTLPYLRQGLNRETAVRTAELIYDFLQPAAVAIVGGQTILAHAGEGADHHEVGGRPLTRLAADILKNGRPLVARSRTEVGCSHPNCPLESAVAVPLMMHRKVVGCLVVFFNERQPITTGKVKTVTALAHLMSLQMDMSELDRKAARLAQAELAALQAQISPHFIYNTLNTIVSFIRTEPDVARELLTDFAEFLRQTFRRKREFSTLAQELEYVHQYLTFEKARFGDRLSVVYRVAPEVLSTVVPTLVLQPLVENAVRHGLSRKVGPGRVAIIAEDRGNECWVSVEDDGVGMDNAFAKQLLDQPHRGPYGIGLVNVHERLRGVYGPGYGLEIDTRPGEGCRVSFSIPKYKVGVRAV
jgi:LytS/YehU family sensor histidine kinase